MNFFAVLIAAIMLLGVVPSGIAQEYGTFSGNTSSENRKSADENYSAEFLLYKKEMDGLIADYGKNCAVYTLPLGGGEAYGYNEDKYVYAASIVKLPYAYFCCECMENDVGGLDDVMVMTENFVSGGTGELQEREVGTELTVEELLYQLFHSSDNTAFKMLKAHFGLDGYKEMLLRDGFEYTIEEYYGFGTVSARMIGFYWEKIYSKQGLVWECLRHDAAETMYSPIKNAVGGRAKVINKTGWAFNSFHESGIVYAEKPYIVVILTQCDGEDEDYEFMYKVTRAADGFYNPPME